MGKTTIPTERWDLERTRGDLGRDITPAMLAFLVRRLGVPDLVLDSETDQLVFPGFLPVRELLGELLEEIDAGTLEVVACERCRGCFDQDLEDGIYGDPAALERFLCARCSSELTAREFYERYLKT